MDSLLKDRDESDSNWLANQLFQKQMRKTRSVYVHFLEFGRPVNAKEVASNCRIIVSEASSLLSRFVERGQARKVNQNKPCLYEAVDPFGYVICLRPGIEVYWRIRRSGKKVLNELALVTVHPELQKNTQNY